MSSQKKGGWGSLFSGAVANLESRLDTILADDPEASARERAAEGAAKQAEPNRNRSNSGNLAAPPSTTSNTSSRDVSRARGSERLAERLAKATQQKAPSRTGTPVHDQASARTSGEAKRSDDVARSVPELDKSTERVEEETTITAESEVDAEEASKTQEPGSKSTSLPNNANRVSLESSRPSTEVTGGETREIASSRQSSELTNGFASKSAAELQSELEQTQKESAEADSQRQEEMLVYLERIDALQTKLTYLAKETVAAAKEANATSEAGSAERELAEKDERIALLMEEGQALSKTEMKHLQTIKKLRAKTTEDEKATALLKRKLERSERSELDLKARVRKAEIAERQANEKTKQIAVIEAQVEELRVDRENSAELVRTLTVQLKETKDKVAQAEQQAASKASEAEKSKIASLQNDLEDAQIEKKLAQDRAASQVKKTEEDAAREQERFSVRELELKNEISGLEARLEAMRARAEEASASSGGAEGESTVKLLRQVETLQQQYSLAKSNWETIEASLHSRNASLEKERDEAAHRESEVRKRARDVGTESRKVKEELANAADHVNRLEQELENLKEEVSGLHDKLQQAEAAQSDAKADFDRQKKILETEVSQRIEEERLKWRRGPPVSPGLGGTNRVESPLLPSRKASGIEATYSNTRKPMKRLTSHDFPPSPNDQRPVSRRSSAMPPLSTTKSHTPPTESSPSMSRRESSLSLEAQSVPPTPSIEVDYLPNDDFDSHSSPRRTINDLVSTSTAGPGVGPSVQLVERMSALVRKLESEKATFKDELSRLSSQRDDARNEVVELMREVEAKRNQEKHVGRLEKDIKELKGRYDASLEMLGEREEEVEEMKLDVVELKRIYRELVEAKVGGG